MQNLMVAATALGLARAGSAGSPWIMAAALKELLGIPAEVEIIAATPLGYHDEPPKPRPVQDRADVYGFQRGDSRALGRLLRGKLALEEVVHHERW